MCQRHNDSQFVFVYTCKFVTLISQKALKPNAACHACMASVYRYNVYIVLDFRMKVLLSSYIQWHDLLTSNSAVHSRFPRKFICLQ